MANYAASVLAKAQVLLDERFQAAEMRQKPSATLMQLRKSSEFLTPDLKELRVREDRPTKAYLKNRAARALTAARLATHSGAIADSTEVDIAYTTYADKFSTSLKRGDNNIFRDAEIMAHEIENALINLHEGIESDLITYLDANKQTASSKATAIERAPFSVVNGVYEIAAGDADQYYHIIKSIFRQEKYPTGMIDVISSSGLVSLGQFAAQQGQGNSSNLGFQFAGLDIAESIELLDANYTNGISFAYPMGMAGILDWIPTQNRAGKGDFDSVLGGFGSIVDPMTGMSIALHGYTERADTSATNGNTQDEVTQWEMSIDLSPQKAPLTAAGQSPIFAIGQL